MLNPELLEAWKNEVREKARQLPQRCELGSLGSVGALGLRTEGPGLAPGETSMWPEFHRQRGLDLSPSSSACHTLLTSGITPTCLRWAPDPLGWARVHGGQWAPAGEPVPTVTSHPQCCEAIYSSVSGLKGPPGQLQQGQCPGPPSAVCSVLPAAPQGPISCVSPWPLGVRASTA